MFYPLSKKMTHSNGSKQARSHEFKRVIDRSLDLLMQPKIRRKIANDIRHIKSRVDEVSSRRARYKIDIANTNPNLATIDPRLLGQYRLETELVGIDDARDELIKILIQEDELCTRQGKIVSIVGFGGLGKTTLANALYEKISAQFECRSFVSVSQTPDLKKIFEDILYDLGKNINGETLNEIRLVNQLRQFLQEKRYASVTYMSIILASVCLSYVLLSLLVHSNDSELLVRHDLPWPC